jgi:hypothetical protein
MARACIAFIGAIDGDPNRSQVAGQEPTDQQVIPILLRRCTVCHGARKCEGDLDLRTRAAMLKGGKSGPAITLGSPDESLLIRRVRLGEMPPLQRLVEVSVKPIEPAEIDLLAQWIEAGAPESQAPPDVAGSEPDPIVTDKHRAFWSFRPPRRPVVPVPHADTAAGIRSTLQASNSSHEVNSEAKWESVRNPIDAFILEKLNGHGLLPSPEADRVTLMRRAYIDLTGLPPEPAEVLEYHADDREDAYERMLERLLASPRYGERWGRHWLDVAGYADSEGKTDQDLRRPHAWRYRDYVVQSFNADKPYDRFLIEQIAGDELADYENAQEITPEIYDKLVATGFLRMAPDGTFANITNFVPDRLEVIADEMQVLGSGVMGLTLHCARCHNHKFDPIPQRDYYRLLDIFKGAFDEHDWLKPNVSAIASSGDWGHRLLPYVTTTERKQWEAEETKLLDEIASLKRGLESRAEPIRKGLAEERLAKLPAELHEDLRRMLVTPQDERTEVQKYLAEKFEKSLTIDFDDLKKVDSEFKKLADETDNAVKTVEAKRVPAPMIHALWDRGLPSPTYVLRRGDFLTPAQRVGPGVPSVLTDGQTMFEVQPPWPGARSTGRRLAFAQWLTQPTNPVTARVMVNRIWKHHFGTGLVKSLGNFGTTGTPPSHPELLDWLATEFVRQGWSIKAMHRIMMTSATYRQASAGVLPDDPDNSFYARMPLRRVDAEVLYDALLLVSGRLDETRFGTPDGVDISPEGQATPRGTPRGWRRSIYVEQRRKQIPTLLETFDLPQMNPNCVERAHSIVTPQALQLWNDGMVYRLAAHFANRVLREAGPRAEDQINWVYLVALSRQPTSEEKQLGVTALARMTDLWSSVPANEKERSELENSPAMRALTNFCHTIMNCAEFLYVD